ncbi:GTP-binding protein [Butyrivibrio sp. MC2021]|uniref:GTP-binding protein n=1 Tax=Butyrivibrio sp. MC2021 TaxID=1408306 RepID=UPI00047A91D6|nr:GTP-binding protein [Butyrivibrio sp. MC2021]
MIKLDLITGFLGSGKTTFIKKYARYFIDNNERICIIENDFGAINVDMVMLRELESDNCNLEMIVGGDGQEAHKRRLKTKLISMAMQGYERVIIEPSGIFDPDEFFDLIYEEPLDRWYEIGNVICIVDPTQDKNISDNSKYILATEAAGAGIILFSKAGLCSRQELDYSKKFLEETMKQFGCLKENTNIEIIDADWNKLGDKDFSRIINCGYNKMSYIKMPIVDGNKFDTIFYFDFTMEQELLRDNIRKIFADSRCGFVHRIKGVVKGNADSFYEINANRQGITEKEVSADRAVLIVIGENLNKGILTEFLGEPTL